MSDNGENEGGAPEVTPEVVPEKKPTGIALPDIPITRAGKKTGIEDKFDSAVKMAFVGVGQGGGRIAETFYNLGYNRCCAINTTNQDLESLTIKHKLVIGHNKGGAGKDPAAGKAAAEESFEPIIDILKRAWGDGVEQMFICVGGGGGSGTGAWTVVVRAIKEYLKISNVELGMNCHLGVILSLPKRSEGPKVQKNALGALENALMLLEAKELSTLVIVDNAKIHEMFPKEPVNSFWKVANSSFANVLHTFNLLAAQNSAHSTYDKADFRGTLRSGLLIFGMCNVETWEGTDDISQAVRQNLKNSLLGDGFDFSKAHVAGAAVVAHEDVLNSIPQENIDYAFHALTRALGNEALTLHTGIYEGQSPGMRVFTMVGGLEPPAARLDELKQKAAK